MASAELPSEAFAVLRDGAGRLYADAEPLPDLPQVLEHARRLASLTVSATSNQPSRRSGGAWTLTFIYRDRQFGIQTDYHAALTLYTSADADCPEPLLREVIAHFEGLRLLPSTWVPPPPLTGHRLLILVLVALVLAIPFVVFLVLLRKP